MPDPVGHGEHRHQQGAVVGGHARVGQGGDVGCRSAGGPRWPAARAGPCRCATPIWLTLRSSISMWSGRASATVTSPPAMPTAARKVAATTRSGTTAWRVGLERVDALDLDARGAGAAHDRPHGAEHLGQVGDLGLLGRVLDHRGALGQHRGHQQVVGRRVAGVLEDHPGADQAAARRPVPRTSPVGRLEARPHGAEAVEVEVDRAVAEVVPAGHGHPHRPQRASSSPSTTTEARILSTSS